MHGLYSFQFWLGCEIFQQEGKTFWTELLCKKKFVLDGQTRWAKIILTAGQSAWCLALDGTPSYMSPNTQTPNLGCINIIINENDLLFDRNGHRENGKVASFCETECYSVHGYQ